MSLTIYRTDAPRVPGNLGRLAAKTPIGSKRIKHYGTLPSAPESVIRPTFASVLWGMLGNDRYGDCTFAGFWHALMVQCLLAGMDLAAITDQEVVQAYLAFTHGQDVGANEADVLSTAFTHGLIGQKITGYAKGSGGIEELCQIINAFGVGYLGVWVTASDQRSFAAGEVWDVNSDVTPLGGHCVDGVEYDSTDNQAKIITWGAEAIVTYDWLEQRVEEQWALDFSAITGQTIDGWDSVQLNADLKAMHGVTA